VGLAVLLALACGLTGRSQSGGGSNSGQQPIHQHAPGVLAPSDGFAPDSAMVQRRMLALSVLRQKQMRADSDKLLKLARELNDEVAAGKPGAWSPEQLRKLAEIEKLAHGVREKMIDSVDQPQPAFQPPSFVFPPY
jgi:hypothetical protein